MPLSEILPATPTLLMGAGPVPIPYQVAQANGLVISHLGETMNRVIARVKEMSKYVFQTTSDHILGLAGPGSAAMEMAITNLLGPGKKVLILNLGTFSARFGELAKRVGAEVIFLKGEDFKPFTVEQVEAELEKNHYDALTLVQGETSCGVKNIHLGPIAAAAKKRNVLVIVDAVCTLSTMPFKMDEWNIDVVMTCGQKGLSSIPGVSLIAFSEDAWKIIEQRNPPHWCLDAKLANRFWSKHEYHYTAPVSGILAIHEALRLICLETLEKRFERHLLSSHALQTGLERMGLQLFIPKEDRLNSVVAIQMPRDLKASDVLKHMLQTFNVEISGAFGLPIVRIGQMGEQCRFQNLSKVLYATGMSFKKFGTPIDMNQGMAQIDSLQNRLDP